MAAMAARPIQGTGLRMGGLLVAVAGHLVAGGWQGGEAKVEVDAD
jgi:hypothetical protein